MRLPKGESQNPARMSLSTPLKGRLRREGSKQDLEVAKLDVSQQAEDCLIEAATED
ncbi:MAG: hypothetical protein ACFB0C_03155 [Leptolyngbyaceae cyanobacterium]